jgi:hypothetical protein
MQLEDIGFAILEALYPCSAFPNTDIILLNLQNKRHRRPTSAMPLALLIK